ncbi:MAG: hypothetical protein AB1324_03790 [Candidatus Micrarchaeota archaeon]
MSRHSVKPINGEAQREGRKPDKWSAMALALDPGSHASTPSAMAQRFSAGALEVSSAVSSFSMWSTAQQLEFARGVGENADPVRKNMLLSALSARVPVAPEVQSILSFKSCAEGIAMDYATANDSAATPNRILSDLDRKYPDASLKAALSQAFEDASELCEEPGRKKLLVRVARGLRANGATA